MPQCSVSCAPTVSSERSGGAVAACTERESAESVVRALSTHWRRPCVGRRNPMFDFRDLFQWERFITPSIIKIFYWLAVGISALFGLSGIVSGLTLMALSPLGGLFWIIGSLIGTVIGVIFARIISEFVLIMFRINEHLGAIRQRRQQMLFPKNTFVIAGLAPAIHQSSEGPFAKKMDARVRPAHDEWRGLLRRKPEMHDVAVGDDVRFALEPHLARLLRAGFAAE